MQPVRETQALGGIARRCEATATVAVDQVLDNGAGLRQQAVVVGERRRLAEGMNGGRAHAQQFTGVAIGAARKTMEGG